MTVHPIDLHFQEKEHAIAAFAVEGPEGWILIETGPESTLDALQSGLHDLNLAPKDISALFLTHIHLDHAGAAGWWSDQGVPIYVHDRGVRHLIQPERLVSSAKMVYGDQFEPLWKDMRPCREDLVHACGDGEVIEVAGLQITALDTPGHAFHHLAFLIDRTLFSGDAAGARLPGNGYISVTSAPPQFDLECELATLEKLEACRANVLFLTHFGEVANVSDHLNDYRDAVELNAYFVRDRLREGMDEASLRIAYGAFQMEQGFRHELPWKQWETFECINSTDMCADGIRLYWEKKGLD